MMITTFSTPANTSINAVTKAPEATSPRKKTNSFNDEAKPTKINANKSYFIGYTAPTQQWNSTTSSEATKYASANTDPETPEGLVNYVVKLATEKHLEPMAIQRIFQRIEQGVPAKTKTEKHLRNLLSSEALNNATNNPTLLLMEAYGKLTGISAEDQATLKQQQRTTENQQTTVLKHEPEEKAVLPKGIKPFELSTLNNNPEALKNAVSQLKELQSQINESKKRLNTEDGVDTFVNDAVNYLALLSQPEARKKLFKESPLLAPTYFSTIMETIFNSAEIQNYMKADTYYTKVLDALVNDSEVIFNHNHTNIHTT